MQGGKPQLLDKYIAAEIQIRPAPTRGLTVQAAPCIIFWRRGRLGKPTDATHGLQVLVYLWAIWLWDYIVMAREADQRHTRP